MKKGKKVVILIGILLTALLMLAACQNPAKGTNPTACPASETNQPVATAQPDPFLVEISMGNWQTYFEIKAVDRWGDNGSGEFTAVTQLTGLWVREEYRDKVVNNGDTSILCTLSFDRAERQVDMDLQRQTYTWGKIVSTQRECQESERINYFAAYPNGELMVFGTANTVERGNTTGQRDENMELVAIEGVLSLAAE